MNWYMLKIRHRYNTELVDDLYMLAHSAEDALVCAEKDKNQFGHVVGIMCVDQPPEDNIEYQIWKSKQEKKKKSSTQSA